MATTLASDENSKAATNTRISKFHVRVLVGLTFIILLKVKELVNGTKGGVFQLLRSDGPMMAQVQEIPDTADRNTSDLSHTAYKTSGTAKMAPHYSVPSVKRGRLFLCGYTGYAADQNTFPDYVLQPGKWDYHAIPPNSTKEDILVYGMHGPCATNSVTDILEHYFQGKVLFRNGEGYGNIFQTLSSWFQMPERFPDLQRVYQIGPYPTNHSIQGNNTFENKSSIDMSAAVVFNRQSMQVTFLSMHFLNVISPSNQNNSNATVEDHVLWKQFTDPSLRPRNTAVNNSTLVYMASHCVPFRQTVAAELAKIVPVQYGGQCRVPGATPVPKHLLQENEKGYFNNFLLFRNYKYCMVFENRQQDGYITEKLFNAYLGGCLPIYYGSASLVYDIFHPDSFIFYDINNPSPALQLLRKLEASDDDSHKLYEQMISSPILKNGSQTINEYFSILPEIGDGSLNRKIRRMMGLAPLI